MKTKVLFLVIALVGVVIFSSCERKSGKMGKKLNTSTHSNVVLLSQQEYDSLKGQLQLDKYLIEEKGEYERLVSNLKKNPNFFLFILDSELSAAEKKQESYGSFSDFFIPTIHEALEAGVSKSEIQKRINRLIQLANNGLFISSYEEKLFKEGGSKAILKEIGLDK